MVMGATRAVAIGNRDDADLGVLGEWAASRGIHLLAIDREDGRLPELEQCSLVVSMGSVWRVHDPELEPLLRPEQELLRRAVDRDVPVLAICFGMQLLTVAFGSEVFPTPRPEIGFTWVEPTDPAVPRGPWMEYHFDACGLPPGTTPLAQNDHGLQAYRLGSALAVQFHPEADLALVKRWSVESSDELDALGLSAAWLVEDTDAHAEAGRLSALALFDGFWSSR
jgi:GMP synthase-like glutamine amidotransferase